MLADRLGPQQRQAESGLRVQWLLVCVHVVPQWIRLRGRGITTGVAPAKDASQRVPSSPGVTCTATGCHLHSPLYHLERRKDQSRMILGHNLRKCLRAAWPGGQHQAGAQGAQGAARGSLRWSHTLVQDHQDLHSKTSVPHPRKRALNRREAQQSSALQSLVAFL